jgi:BirA family biotin operon repressor/biotin-[acetyl-CoA-carboxylase] ligase
VTVASGFVTRLERFDRVGSTNDVVRDWLAAGAPEGCVAVAAEQTTGRGRAGRTWVAPSGAGLLLSVGFRPTWLEPDRVWRLAAIVSLAMAEAAERASGMTAGRIRLKWPNDLVIEGVDDPIGSATDRPIGDGVAPFAAPGRRAVRKLGGVLGETAGLGSAEPTAIVGIGLNVGWARSDFPADLADTMTSLVDLAGAGAPDRDALLDGFLARLEAHAAALHDGSFDARTWSDRQITNGALVELQGPDGEVELVRALGVDGDTGALTVEAAGRERSVVVGEIRRVRLAAV